MGWSGLVWFQGIGWSGCACLASCGLGQEMVKPRGYAFDRGFAPDALEARCLVTDSVAGALYIVS